MKKISDLEYGELYAEYMEVIKELEKYKSIEEELGIDLIILFSALKNGVFTKQNYFEFPILIISYDKKGELGFNFLVKGKLVYFKDYGKTWALTKGELNNEYEKRQR